MFRPYIKDKKVLVALAVANLILVYISYNSFEFEPDKNYELKIQSLEIMEDALTQVLDSDLPHGTDKLDIYNSGLIGVDSLSSFMTTKSGNKYSKHVKSKFSPQAVAEVSNNSRQNSDANRNIELISAEVRSSIS